jgi:hypothetical protein
MLAPRKGKELSYHYKFFGLSFCSNRFLPGMPVEENPPERRDLVLHLGNAPYAEPRNRPASEESMYVSSDTDDKGDPILQIWRVKQGAFVRMAYKDGTQFWMDQLLENIWATWPDRLPFENMTSYLLGPVLGLLLRLRGVVCLHASAVSIKDRAVAFVGSPGAGKSTTAAACSKVGHGVLCDDIVALEERNGSFYVTAAHPQLRLWPEAVELLYGATQALQRFNPEWDKRHLGLGDFGTRFENRALPLGTIYILGDRLPDRPPHVEPLRSQAALLSLVADTYANSILDRGLRAHEFEVLGRLVSKVLVRRLRVPNGLNHPEEFCRIISEDLARVHFSSAA